MICPACHGLRGEFADLPDGRRAWIPCPSCIGGVASCCDGAVGGPADTTNAGETEREDD